MAEWHTKVPSLLRTGWRWWVAELAAFVPARLRRRIATWRSRIVLLADAPGDNLVLESGDRRRTLGRIDLGAEPGAPSRDHLVGVASRRHGTDVIMRLGARRALHTTVTLPAAAARNLDQVVGFEFERLAPFRRDDVYYAYRVISQEPGSAQLRLELTVVPRLDLAEASRALQRRGMRLAGLEVAGATPAAAPIAIPLTGTDHAAPRRRSGAVVATLGACAVLLAIACVAIPLVEGRNAIDQLTAEVADAKRLADASLRVQKQIEAESQGRQFLLARKRATPTVTELLDALTRLTPDDAFLTELQINGTRVRLLGAAASATTLLGLVDAAKEFRNAAFESPITQDPRLKRERFDIAAKIAPKAAP